MSSSACLVVSQASSVGDLSGRSFTAHTSRTARGAWGKLPAVCGGSGGPSTVPTLS
jgi:hypothetical protein